MVYSPAMDERLQEESLRKPHDVLDTLICALVIFVASECAAGLAGWLFHAVGSRCGWAAAAAFEAPPEAPLNGFVFSVNRLGHDVVGLALIGALVIRRVGSFRVYFETAWPRWWAVCLHVGTLVGFLAGVHVFGRMLIGPFRVPSVDQLYLTAGSRLLLCLTLVILGPLNEEVFWRGLVFSGLARSRGGPWGAVVVTSGLWALSHTHLGGMEVLALFGLGLYLGLVRVWTKSVVLTFVLHAIWNAFALFHAAVMNGGF